jgi:hypothetical protein
MGQLTLLTPLAGSGPATLIDLSGFDVFYPLLRALVSVQDIANFHERLRLLLELARWQDEPPDVNTLARILGRESEELANTLGLLRSTGWLADGYDARRYGLSPQGRILIAFLQFLAQPWAEGDDTAVSAQLYDTAEQLGIRQDLLAAQFSSVLSALEDRARQMGEAQNSEDTEVVARLLSYSRRDMKLAHRALELREKGATQPEAYGQVQRMHNLISRLMGLAGQLDTRYQRLLARDLLAQGAVTLGDIMAWARSAEQIELAGSLLPYLHPPFRQVWAYPETALLDTGAELAGRPPRSIARMRPPEPVELYDFQAMADIDEIKQRLYRTQAAIRQHLINVDPLPLVNWVDQADWETAVVHFAAALDPELRHATEPVYLHLDSEGKQVEAESSVVALVTIGNLSRSDPHE